MTLENFTRILLGGDAIPDGFGVYHHRGSELAVIQASCSIDSYDSLEAVSDETGLEELEYFFRTTVQATPERIVSIPLIETNKDMSIESRHGQIRLKWV